MQRVRRFGPVTFGILALALAVSAGLFASPRPTEARATQGRYLSVAVSEAGEALVSWRDTPGNSTDWVSVIRAGAPDDTYDSTWTYTNGQVSGLYTTGRLSPGQFEARLYLDWPFGGYAVADRVYFEVGADSSGGFFAGRSLSVAIGAVRDTVVLWNGTPGNSGDWVSVVRAGVSDDTYESTWSYTNGQVSGSYSAGRLAPGNYEARLYLDWPAGGFLVVDRVAFTVR